MADNDGDTATLADAVTIESDVEEGDSLSGTAEGETIAGGSDDNLAGGDGDDFLFGGAGDDVFFYDDVSIADGDGSGATDHDVILDYAAGDTIDLDALFDILDPTGASRLDVATTSTGDFDGDGNGADSKITVRDASGNAVTDFSIILEDYSASLDIDPGANGSV